MERFYVVELFDGGNVRSRPSAGCIRRGPSRSERPSSQRRTLRPRHPNGSPARSKLTTDPPQPAILAKFVNCCHVSTRCSTPTRSTATTQPDTAPPTLADEWFGAAVYSLLARKDWSSVPILNSNWGMV